MWSVPSRFSEPSRRCGCWPGCCRGAQTAAGVRDHAELGRQHDLVAAALEGPADEFLVDERAVDLGGVEQGDAQIQRPVDGADGLRVIGAGAGVARRHPHGAQTDTATVQVPQLDMLHRLLSPSI